MEKSMNEQGKGRVRRWVAAAAMAVAGMAAVPAQAAVFVTNWDPLFGAGLSGATGIASIGWEGKAVIDADASCLSVIGAPENREVGVDCLGPVTVTSLVVQFWSGSPATPVGSPMVATSLPTVEFIDVAPDGNDVDLLADVVGADAAALLVKTGFVLGAATFDVHVDFLGGPYAGIQLKLVRTDCCETVHINEGEVAVSWVPEPGTLALIGAAILGLRLRRRI